MTREKNGGDVCESNTPKTFCVPHNGFEDRGTHQGSIRPHYGAAVQYIPLAAK